MSPLVARDKGYSVYIWSKDHPRPHVHVEKDGKAAKVELSPVQIVKNGGFTSAEQQEIIEIVRSHKGHCWAIWHQTHGK